MTRYMGAHRTTPDIQGALRLVWPRWAGEWRRRQAIEELRAFRAAQARRWWQ